MYPEMSTKTEYQRVAEEGRAAAALGLSTAKNPYSLALQRAYSPSDAEYGRLKELEAYWNSGFLGYFWTTGNK